MHDVSGIVELLRSIINGVDPSTGEIFNPRELYDRPELHRVAKLLSDISAGHKKPESSNRLNRPSAEIFTILKEWRLEQASIQALPAYMIFTDKELWSIAEGDVCVKEDLLLVNGISDKRYEAYGDDLFEIIKPFI